MASRTSRASLRRERPRTGREWLDSLQEINEGYMSAITIQDERGLQTPTRINRTSGTLEWYAGGKWRSTAEGVAVRRTIRQIISSGTAGLVSDHEDLGGLQGGYPGQHYHFNQLHHAQLAATIGVSGFDSYLCALFGTQITATTGLQCPIEAHRTTDETAIVQAGVLAKALSSGNMADGFGSGYLFAIEDTAEEEDIIAGVYAVRAGADGTGDLIWKPATAGTLNERMRLTAAGQLRLGVGSAAVPSYSYAGRTTDGAFSAGEGALGWATGGVQRMSLAGYVLTLGADSLGETQLVMHSDAAGRYARLYLSGTYFGVEAWGAGHPVIVQSDASYVLLRAGTNAAGQSVYIDAGGSLIIRDQDDSASNAATFDTGTNVWWWQPTATALASNGTVAQSSTYNTLVGRMGDTNVRFGGTVKNVDSDLAEFESDSGLVQTMWSDTVDKDLWVTGKPINVFAIIRMRLPEGDGGGEYTNRVEIVLGTETIVSREFKHTLGNPAQSGFYYVELHARITKYASTSLRTVTRTKESVLIPFASWSEGAALTLTEKAYGRVLPVTEDVTSANTTLAVKVTFSRQVPGLRCYLMDADWGPETPVV